MNLMFCLYSCNYTIINCYAFFNLLVFISPACCVIEDLQKYICPILQRSHVFISCQIFIKHISQIYICPLKISFNMWKISLFVLSRVQFLSMFSKLGLNQQQLEQVRKSVLINFYLKCYYYQRFMSVMFTTFLCWIEFKVHHK